MVTEGDNFGVRCNPAAAVGRHFHIDELADLERRIVYDRLLDLVSNEMLLQRMAVRCPSVSLARTTS